MLTPYHRTYYIRCGSKIKQTGESNYEFSTLMNNWSDNDFMSTKYKRWYVRVAYICLQYPDAAINWFTDQNTINLHIKNGISNNTYDAVDGKTGEFLLYQIPRPVDDTGDTYYYKDYDAGATTSLGVEISNPEIFNGGELRFSLTANVETGAGDFSLPGDDEVEMTLQLNCIEYPEWEEKAPFGAKPNRGLTDNPFQNPNVNTSTIPNGTTPFGLG